MKHLFLLLMLMPFICLAQEGQENKDEGVAPPAFDTYWMVFLKSGGTRSQSNEEALKIQRGHLAHLGRLVKEGKMLVAGPLEVPPEYEIRGICFYPGDTPKETVIALASEDPAVKAGRLRVEVIKWWTPKGTVAFTPSK